MAYLVVVLVDCIVDSRKVVVGVGYLATDHAKGLIFDVARGRIDFSILSARVWVGNIK